MADFFGELDSGSPKSKVSSMENGKCEQAVEKSEVDGGMHAPGDEDVEKTQDPVNRNLEEFDDMNDILERPKLEVSGTDEENNVAAFEAPLKAAEQIALLARALYL